MVAVSNESVIQARRRLRAILAELYSEKRQAIRVVDDAGLLKSNITFSDRAVDNWHYILQEAENQQKLDNLIKVVKLEYSTNLEFHEVCRRYEDVLSQQGAKSSKEVEVSFTNRIDEINAILSTHAAAYYRLNALMGYGKTKLLLELERRFREEQNWLCAYVCVDLNSGLKELTTALVQELGISSWYNSADRSASPSDGALLGNALNRFWQKSGEPGKGIALLIDFDVRPSNREQTKLIESFVRRVWEELIPEVQRPLRSLKNFKENHNRFRVIMASRPVTITYLSYPVSSRNLSPFTFDVIRSSVATFLSEVDVDIEDINQFAAHLFYLTGGHPGCMAQTLKLYSETMLPPDEWLEKYENIVWRDIISKAVTHIFDEVCFLSDIVNTFKYSLSVLRTLDQIVLGHIIDSHMVRNDIDEIKFEDDLRATGLYHPKGRFLCDAISQRLFAIKLRHEEPASFGTHSKQAQDICVQRLNDPRVQNPEKWVVEYLFQYLQSQTEKIRQHQNRQQIKHDFFGIIVTRTVAMYINTRNVQKTGWRTERQVLINEIEKDWEFQFAVNYYLREEKYNDQPFEQLINCIETTQI